MSEMVVMMMAGAQLRTLRLEFDEQELRTKGGIISGVTSVQP